MATIKFSNTYIKNASTIAGPMEGDSKLKGIDFVLKDYYFFEKTFEQAEVRMQRFVMDNVLEKCNIFNKDIDLIIGGDLLDQISATSYTCVGTNIPLLGIYSACATFTESLLLGALFLKNSNFKNILTLTSSHNKTSERQFRYPVEYGYPRPHTSTFTATGAVSSVITKDKGIIKIESATIGKVIEMGVKDTNNMGAVMTPAAANTLYEHLSDLNRDVSYYDLILTGDLGCVGMDLFKNYVYETYKIKLNKYLDSGCELYLNSENVYSGGSGPVCLPLVLFNKIILNDKYKKILIIGTGSLHSKTFVNQHLSIPAIAHAVSLEVL